MGGGIRMAETTGNGTTEESTTSDDGSDPSYYFLIDCFSVVEECFDTTEGCAVCVINPDFGDSIDIGYFVCDSRNFFRDGSGDIDVGVYVDTSYGYRTETCQSKGTSVDFFTYNQHSIRQYLNRDYINVIPRNVYL